MDQVSGDLDGVDLGADQIRKLLKDYTDQLGDKAQAAVDDIDAQLDVIQDRVDQMTQYAGQDTQELHTTTLSMIQHLDVVRQAIYDLGKEPEITITDLTDITQGPGLISGCAASCTVNGDANVGGIAGTVSPELGDDPEETLELDDLKLLADVGLVGFPNVGKSTLLSVVSRAQPKIANYHFTTLFPNLGVVYVEEGVSFVMADIPGIIEGAADGAGLGHDFLRHIDRCRLLIHIVDVSGSEGRDPVEDFETINAELKEYSPELASRKMLVAANKTDIMADPALLDKFRAHVEGLGLELFEISAAAHQGTRELVKKAAQELAQLPPVAVYEPTYVERPPEVDTSGEVSIEKYDDTWVVEASWLQHLMANVNFGDYESRNWFDRKLRESGLFDRLEAMGIQDGDLVSLYNLDFEYQR